MSAKRNTALEGRRKGAAARRERAHLDPIGIIRSTLRTRREAQVHPRGDMNRPVAGVFATRSPDRPNPLGLHRVTVREMAGARLRIGPIEAVDGTPVVDIKPVLDGPEES
jgi:tRNA-Thr(GGU) m(6)t(6)A37 methyltransferase TsaA